MVRGHLELLQLICRRVVVVRPFLVVSGAYFRSESSLRLFVILSYQSIILLIIA